MSKPTYEELRSRAVWKPPRYYNIGVDICDKWANERYRLALIFLDEDWKEQKYTFWELKNLSNQLANALRASGIERGDRVGILLPQCPETAISHIAIYKIGAIAIPLFTLFGPHALEYRLGNSEAKGVITDRANVGKVLETKDRLPNLRMIMAVDAEGQEGVLDFWESVEKGSRCFTPVLTKPDDPAFITYTSGTTGPPKGALHGHRVVLAHLSSFSFIYNLYPKKRDLFWTPADWAWFGGLMDVLLPSWHWGMPVVAFRARKFDPEEAFHLIRKYEITGGFMPPTALKMMAQVQDAKKIMDGYLMRAIATGGETAGKALIEWGREVLGMDMNEAYGQTEANLLTSNCAEIAPIVPGSMGRACPGRIVEIIDENGEVLEPGKEGEVGVKSSDPIIMLEYWRNPEATSEKYLGGWWRTGDYATKDENGYFWFIGRRDDVIESGAYRVGPGEVEDSLIKHKAVAMAGVVGVPDEVRGERIKAFIVLKEGLKPDKALEDDIKQFVKTKLEAYAYPREIEFVKELPMTITGKIKRDELRRMHLEKGAKA